MNLEQISNHIIYSQQEGRNYNFFCDILKKIKEKDKDIFTMMEIGCEEGYYSASFREIFGDKSKNLLIEPRLECWEKFGKSYFENKKNVYFYNNYISQLAWAHWGGPNDPGALKIKNEIKSISIEQILQESNTNIVDILHMDVQGSEFYIIKDLINTGSIAKINYLFVMTHNFDSINYNSYIELLKNSSVNYEFIFNDPSYRDGSDGLLIVKINQ